MADAVDSSFLNEENASSITFFTNYKTNLEVPSQAFNNVNKTIFGEQQISESLEKLSTKSDENESLKFRKRIRVGNHYQARIPKILEEGVDYDYEGDDELLWDPYILDSEQVEHYLEEISSMTKLLLPTGNHLRDNEKALYLLQKHNHDTDATLKDLSNEAARTAPPSLWNEEDCRNFEKGLLNFGKNFFLIQKYRLMNRHVTELVQFYYLWKKTERCDLFAHQMRGNKKKYALNPGISDLMCRYLGRPKGGDLGTDVQFIMTDDRKRPELSHGSPVLN